MFVDHPLDNGIHFSFRQPHATYYGTLCSRERIHLLLVTRVAKTSRGVISQRTSPILARDDTQLLLQILSHKNGIYQQDRSLKYKHSLITAWKNHRNSFALFHKMRDIFFSKVFTGCDFEIPKTFTNAKYLLKQIAQMHFIASQQAVKRNDCVMDFFTS